MYCINQVFSFKISPKSVFKFEAQKLNLQKDADLLNSKALNTIVIIYNVIYQTAFVLHI